MNQRFVGGSLQFPWCGLADRNTCSWWAVIGPACEYDKQNLYYSQIVLENIIMASLQQRIVTLLRVFDGGPALWNILQKTLWGAATSKMIKAQKIIDHNHSRSCLFVRHFSLISFHLVPVMALTHLMKHTLSQLRSSNSSAHVSQPHRRRFMTITMKKRCQIIGLSCFSLWKTLEGAKTKWKKALEAWLILWSMSGQSLR